MSGVKDDKKKLNDFDEQMKEIDEWQKNSANPGHYIGTGKVQTPMKNLFKAPILIVLLGIIIAVPTIYNLINNLTFENIISNVVNIVLSVALIIGGVFRLINSRG